MIRVWEGTELGISSSLNLKNIILWKYTIFFFFYPQMTWSVYLYFNSTE